MKLRLALLAAAALSGPAWGNNCAAPTSRDNQLSLSGIVNSYYPVVATASGYSSTTKTFDLGPARTCAGCGQHIFAPGDMVLVIQHQRMQINSTNGTTYAYGTGATNSAGSPGRGWTNPSDTARFGFYRVTASSATLSGGSITVTGGNGDGIDFPFGAAASGTNIRSTQVVHVPQLANVTLGGTLTAPAFGNASSNASGIPQYTGGVVVLDVAATLNFNGQTIDVSGKGFRGGGGRQLTGSATGTASNQVANTDYVKSSASVSAHGSKGEGTVGTPRYVLENGFVRDITDQGALFSVATDGYPGGSLGRGAPGNAGGGGTDNAPSPVSTGNSQNTGGGGGAGYGDGGQGGQFGSAGNPGLGGVGLKATLMEQPSNATNNAIGGIWQYASLGGGGGAGSANDSANASAASGAAGGGIVIIRAQAVTGSGQILANGADATAGPTGDAAGGGGGGGWIVLAANQQANVAAPSLLLQARGGNGGSTSGAGNNSGVGGGGGGGAIATTANLAGVSASVSGGLAGTAAGTSASAANGESGFATTFPSIYHVGVGTLSAKGASSRSVSSGAECVPFISKSYSPALALSGADRTFTVSVTNPNGGTYPRSMGFLDLTDDYPGGIVNAASPNLSSTASCGGPSQTATPGAGQFKASGGTISGGATCTWTMKVTVTGTSTLTNTIPQDSTTVRISPGNADEVTTINETPAVASVNFPAPATATKTSVVFSDPINGQTSPKRIPGALVDYTIGITNTVGGTLDNNSMVLSDALPAAVKLFVGDLAGGSPYEFAANASNLTCTGCITYSTLASPNVNNDSDWTYAPIADSDGADANVKHVRFKTSGAMADGSSISFRYRTVVK